MCGPPQTSKYIWYFIWYNLWGENIAKGIIGLFGHSKYSMMIRPFIMPVSQIRTVLAQFQTLVRGWLSCSSRASLSSTYMLLCRFYLNTHFFLKLIVLTTGGPESCIQMALIRPFVLRLVLLLLFKCFSSSF